MISFIRNDLRIVVPNDFEDVWTFKSVLQSSLNKAWFELVTLNDSCWDFIVTILFWSVYDDGDW